MSFAPTTIILYSIIIIVNLDFQDLSEAVLAPPIVCLSKASSSELSSYS